MKKTAKLFCEIMLVLVLLCKNEENGNYKRSYGNETLKICSREKKLGQNKI
jgi:hypothetical protein